MKIEIESLTYKELEKLAVGFETPNDVISRLILSFKSSHVAKPEGSKSAPNIYYNPSPVGEFKQKLLETKKAHRVIIYHDGSHEVSYWDASRFDEKSNLEGNIRSGVLRNWQEKDIKSLILSIDPVLTDTESLKKLMQEPTIIKRDSTRAKASLWLKKHYPFVTNAKFRSSKYFHDREKWFFTLPSKFLEEHLTNDVYFLLERAYSSDDFHLLKVHADFFVSNRSKIETRIQNGNEVFDLFISANKSSWLKTTNTVSPIDFSVLLVE